MQARRASEGIPASFLGDGSRFPLLALRAWMEHFKRS